MLNELQEAILKEGLTEEHPSLSALIYIKNEVSDLF
jgi:hypothetical protein